MWYSSHWRWPPGSGRTELVNCSHKRFDCDGVGQRKLNLTQHLHQVPHNDASVIIFNHQRNKPHVNDIKAPDELVSRVGKEVVLMKSDVVRQPGRWRGLGEADIEAVEEGG